MFALQSEIAIISRSGKVRGADGDSGSANTSVCLFKIKHFENFGRLADYHLLYRFEFSEVSGLCGFPCFYRGRVRWTGSFAL